MLELFLKALREMTSCELGTTSDPPVGYKWVSACEWMQRMGTHQIHDLLEMDCYLAVVEVRVLG